MEAIYEIERLKAWRLQAREPIAFVPTMGALHSGHLSLIDQARDSANTVAVSIFINPKQFGPNEDFKKYPRTLQEDLELLNKEHVDIVFCPTIDQIYPSNFQTTIKTGDIANRLCGLSRPGHFDGVLTIVLKLFNLLEPNLAFFGKKDYQQLKIIEKMVSDLNLNIKVIGCETQREQSGLAMSSRNRYLNESARAQAGFIFKKLNEIKSQPNESAETIINNAVDDFRSNGFEVEYLEICDRQTLNRQVKIVKDESVLLIAVKFNGVRLIDNLEF